MMFESYVKTNKEQFLLKVQTISQKLGINPDWLMCTMYLESRINPQAVNSYTGATGLIQFMPRTAAALGTSTSSLYSMSNVAQLDYVYAYLKPYTGRMKSLVDVYFAVFFPAAIGKSDDTVLKTSTLSAGIIAKQNAGYDLNADKMVTVGEVKTKIYKILGIQVETDGTVKKKTRSQTTL